MLLIFYLFMLSFVECQRDEPRPYFGRFRHCVLACRVGRLYRYTDTLKQSQTKKSRNNPISCMNSHRSHLLMTYIKCIALALS